MLQYHSGDKYATPATEAKAAEYGVRGFPSIYFDGGNPVIGAGSELSAYNAQTSKIAAALAKPPAVALSATVSFSGGITVTAAATNTGSSTVSGLKLYVVIYEDLGTAEHHYTVRDVLSPVAIVSLASGAVQQFSVKSSYGGSQSNLQAVVFIKSASGEVLQVALAGK
ncbi:hypothetical protein [Dehalogenimonas alkenigignens]|uniref:Thioredoxin n=1 Tax=Dehalogenimonas alkenigignens TaxID=1217799 RepID=A0A0W0GHT2_9CHLR|nr:hypothetical protein [Dehalogenimonas alkenigignens]KTB48111.1 hypothetical protein DEALK_09560 [Dehalogenimonas alkenigignens]PVV84361.1 hypothetical protein DD509_03445 [Dehalogenimonas alkenigignens]